ncbi:MAG: DUF222 domain-containing protein [Propionibacteriaceae bacterium]
MSTTTEPTGYGDPLARIRAGLDQMVAVENWQMSDDQAMVEMDALGVLGERIAGLRLRRTQEVETRKLCRDRGWTTADHLMTSDRTPLRTARAYVYFSRHLNRFNVIGDAVCNGTVTTEQAQAMVHGLKHLPAEITDEQVVSVQESLIAEADELHPNDLRLLANRAVAILFPEVEEDRLGKLLEREEKRARRDRYLAFGRSPSGSVTFKGQLSPVDGEKFITLITAYAQQLKNQHAQAEDRLDPLTETPTTAQLQADALVAMLEHLFAEQSAPQSGGDRPRVSILLPLEDLVNGTNGATLTNSGEPISPETARHLACDADLIPVVLDTDGVVLDVGRTQRLFTRGIRHGLEVRDQGCVFPRCEAPPQRCEAHHLTPWHLGGETALHNGALLCRHHHTIVEPDPHAPKAPGGLSPSTTRVSRTCSHRPESIRNDNPDNTPGSDNAATLISTEWWFRRAQPGLSRSFDRFNQGGSSTAFGQRRV